MCVTQHPKVHHPSDFRKSWFLFGLKCGFSGGTTQPAYPGSTSVAFSVNQCRRGRRSLVHGPQPSNPVAGQPLIEGHIYPLWLSTRVYIYSHLPKTGYQIRYNRPHFYPSQPLLRLSKYSKNQFWYILYPRISKAMKKVKEPARELPVLLWLVLSWKPTDYFPVLSWNPPVLQRSWNNQHQLFFDSQMFFFKEVKPNSSPILNSI